MPDYLKEAERFVGRNVHSLKKQLSNKKGKPKKFFFFKENLTRHKIMSWVFFIILLKDPIALSVNC